MGISIRTRKFTRIKVFFVSCGIFFPIFNAFSHCHIAPSFFEETQLAEDFHLFREESFRFGLRGTYIPSRGTSDKLPEELTIASFNVSGLFEAPFQNLSDRYFLQAGIRRRSSIEFSYEIPAATSLAEAIARNNPDILLLQEANSAEQLRYFVKTYLANRYTVLSSEIGKRPDTMGILIKRSLPFEADYYSFKDLKIEEADGRMVSGFVRDTPIIALKKKGESDALLVIGNIHFKSLRDYSNALKRRRLERKAFAQVLDFVEEKFIRTKGQGPETPVIFMGDFNAPLNKTLTALSLLFPSDKIFPYGYLPKKNPDTFSGDKALLRNGPFKECDGVMLRSNALELVVSENTEFIGAHGKPVDVRDRVALEELDDWPSDHADIDLKLRIHP